MRGTHQRRQAATRVQPFRETDSHSEDVGQSAREQVRVCKPLRGGLGLASAADSYGIALILFAMTSLATTASPKSRPFCGEHAS